MAKRKTTAKPVLKPFAQKPICEFCPVHNLIGTVKSGIYMADTEGNLTFVNQAFADILGYTDKEELLGLNLSRKLYANPKEREGFLAKLQEKEFVIDYEVKNIRKDGSVVTLSATSNFIKNDRGDIIGVEGVVEDITRRKLIEEELKFEKLKLEQILSVDQQISTILDLDKLVDFVIEKASEILNAQRCSVMFVDYDSQELVIKGARGLSDEVIKETRVKLGAAVAGIVAKEERPLLVANIESHSLFSRENKPSYKSKSFISVPIKIQNRLVGVLNVTEKSDGKTNEFTPLDLRMLCAIVRQAAVAIENANLYKELKYLSVTDSLTHLYNHRHFIKSLDQEILRLKRYPNPLSLMMIDVDNFKSYNDIYGHLQGDILLKEIGKIIKRSLREIDIPCRYGGDEFAAILIGIDPLKAKVVAQKLSHAVSQLALKGNTSLSIGIAAFAEKMDRFDLFLKADQALYQAKREGRNKICVYA